MTATTVSLKILIINDLLSSGVIDKDIYDKALDILSHDANTTCVSDQTVAVA